jgi:hypothetical protein
MNFVSLKQHPSRELSQCPRFRRNTKDPVPYPVPGVPQSNRARLRTTAQAGIPGTMNPLRLSKKKNPAGIHGHTDRSLKISEPDFDRARDFSGRNRDGQKYFGRSRANTKKYFPGSRPFADSRRFPAQEGSTHRPPTNRSSSDAGYAPVMIMPGVILVQRSLEHCRIIPEMPAGILVQRSLQNCRLYLFSLGPHGWEVIIRKNAEQGPEFTEDYRRE